MNIWWNKYKMSINKTWCQNIMCVISFDLRTVFKGHHIPEIDCYCADYCNSCANRGKIPKLLGIIIHTMMIKTWYGTPSALTVVDLGAQAYLRGAGSVFTKIVDFWYGMTFEYHPKVKRGHVHNISTSSVLYEHFIFYSSHLYRCANKENA